jgi:glycosyltransferase involved in cell wall biosynthesis
MKESSTQERISVLFLEDPNAGNPYISLLINAIKEKGVDVNVWIYRSKMLPITRAFLKQKSQIVHVHWLQDYFVSETFVLTFVKSVRLIADVFIARILGAKIVWTVHNITSHEADFPWLEKWLGGIVASLVNHLIVHSDSNREVVVSQYKICTTSISVIPHGHYKDFYGPLVPRAEARLQLKLPETPRIYLNFGLLRPYKGTDILLETWAQHHKKNNKDLLVIAGKPYSEEYKIKLRQVISGIGGVSLFDHFIADDMVNLFLSSADIFVLPFVSVLNSGSLLLAMSYGKPVIAPDFGGLSETLGSASALLYSCKNEHGLLNAFGKSTAINLASLGELTSQECEKFNWSTVAEKTIDVYKKVLFQEK